MLARVLSSLCLCFLLAGCVLQSPTPLFTDAQASLLPQSLGLKFEMQNLDKGAWSSENDVISLVLTGKHYVAHNGQKNDTIEVLFVSMGNNWWLMQAAEPTKPSSYILAQSVGSMLLLRPLYCDDLKGKADITFKDGDCTLNGKPSIDYFQQFTMAAKPAKMRLKPVK